MAMKSFRKDVGWGETFATFHKGCRKYHVKFWKQTCPWYRRPRQCVKAFIMITNHKPLKERLLIEMHYKYSERKNKKRWQ